MSVSRKQRVLVVSHFPSPYQVELFDAVKKSDLFDLSVLYLNRFDNTRSWNKVELLHNAHFIDKEDINKKLLEQFLVDKDIVIFNFYTDSIAANLIGLRSESHKPWCLWGERPGYKLPQSLGKFYRKFRLGQLHASQAPVWGIGQWALDAYKNEFGIERKYINVPYFSNLTKFAGSPRKKFDKNQLRILFSGALSRRKGIDLLLKAFNSITNENKSVYLDLIGDGPLRPLVKKYVHRNPRITWHGFQHWEDLPAFYANADILCVPSRYDGWGLVVPEGMAAGLPVIATDRMGAAHDMIQQGKNGWKIIAGNINDLKSTLIEAMSLDRERFAVMSENACETAINYGLEAGVRLFNNAVQETLQAWNE